jgi:hypothetical protein
MNIYRTARRHAQKTCQEPFIVTTVRTSSSSEFIKIISLPKLVLIPSSGAEDAKGTYSVGPLSRAALKL